MTAKSVLAEALSATATTCVGLASSIRSVVSDADAMGQEYRILSLLES